MLAADPMYKLSNACTRSQIYQMLAADRIYTIQKNLFGDTQGSGGYMAGGRPGGLHGRDRGLRGRDRGLHGWARVFQEKKTHKKEKSTAPGIPRRSPIQVLTGLSIG